MHKPNITRWLTTKKCFFCTMLLFLAGDPAMGTTNPPPPFIFSENSDNADLIYKISWSDHNTENESVSFYYSEVNGTQPESIIVLDIPVSDTRNHFFWNTAHIPAGIYRLRALYRSGESTSDYVLTPPISISHAKHCLKLDSRKNLLTNPGFEKGKKTPDDWKIIVPDTARERSWEFKWVQDPDKAHGGTGTIEIANIFNGINSESAWQDRVIIESSKSRLDSASGRYILTAWLRTTGVEAGHASFKVKYYDVFGFALKERWAKSDIFYDSGGPDSQWRQIAFIVTPPHQENKKGTIEQIPRKFSLSLSLDNSPGTLLIDDVSFAPISEAEYAYHNPVNRYKAPPIVPSSAPLRTAVPANNGFDLFNDSGVWWLVDPDKNFRWLRGTSPSTNHFLLQATGLSRQEYIKHAEYLAARDLNFNQRWRNKNVDGTYGSLQGDIVWLNFSSEADISEAPEKWGSKDRNNELIDRRGHLFPDVFSPIWQKYAARHADSLNEDNGWSIENKQTIGYWTDNEWAYGDLFDFIWGDASKIAFLDWLQGKNDLPSLLPLFESNGIKGNLHIPKGFELDHPFSKIHELNQAWSSKYHSYHYNSFDEIAKSDKPFIRGHDDPVRTELLAFERVIYKIYVDTVIDNIRRAENVFSAKTGIDRKHLIFSNRFTVDSSAALSGMERNMDLFSRFDVIAVNLYPYFNSLASFYPHWLLKKIKKTFHDSTGKPLYISEFGLAAEDANSCALVPCMEVARWRPNTVRYQYERGWAYHNIMSTFSNLPYIIGANWFKWTNGYGTPPGSDTRNSGMVDDANRYYSDFTNMVRSTNRQISGMNRSESFSLEDIDWSVTKVNICEP